MNLLIKNGLVLQHSNFLFKNIFIKDGRFSSIEEIDNNTADAEAQVIDAKGKFIVPGFIDIHTHGAVGEDVNNVSPSGIEKIAKYFASQGTTSWLMSILTDRPSQINLSIKSFNEYIKLEKKINNLIGIHLEGPFLSPTYKGSMPEQLLKEYDQSFVLEAIKLSNNHIKYMTVAPEVPGVLDAIPFLIKKGIIVSIGHSGATYEIARKAIKNGAASSTHTFNAMGLFHQHFPGIMGAILESKTIFCEAICDGKHLHPGAIRMLIKTMGIDKVIMVTDSIMATGMPDGNYRLGVNNIIVKNGDAVLKSDRSVRAGSTLTTGNALKNMLKYSDLSLGEILQMCTLNPAKLLKIDADVGSITAGKRANFLQLDLDGSLMKTWIDGKLVWERID